MWNVQLFELNYDHRERQAADDAISSGWITMGQRTINFEEAFQSFLGGESECVAVSSATAALHMALLALDVGPGDEVIIPALTFVAAMNVVRLVGAIPVLADSVSLDDWNVSAQTIERCITDRTKAVIVVHFAGFPCRDMTEIADLCRARNIGLIEDAAHAPGASVDGRMCGTIGDIGCFSFYSNKNLTIGEGGMVCAGNPEHARTLRLLRSHGMNAPTLDRFKGRSVSYDVMRVGLNYRMDEIRAAIGLVQLDKLAGANERRRRIFGRYRQNLHNSSGTIPFAEAERAGAITSSYHILPVLLPEFADRREVIAKLKSAGIQTSIHYPPFWSFDAFSDYYSAADAPVAAEICARELTLPLYPGMSESQTDLVTSTLEQALSATGAHRKAGEFSDEKS